MCKTLICLFYLIPALVLANIKNDNIYFHPVEEIYVDELPQSIMDLEFVHSVSKLPIVFRGAAKNWKAMNWTPEILEARGLRGIQEVMKGTLDRSERILYGLNVGFFIGTRRTQLVPGTDCKIDQLIELLKDVNYYEINLCNDISGKDLNLLEENTDFNLGHFSDTAYEYYILAGSEGFQMNIFHNHETAILAEFYGEKMVFLAPPHSPENEHELNEAMDKVTGLIRNTGVDSINDIKNTIYSAFQQVILKPGDVLYIPSGWYHRVHYLTPCLGITQGINFDRINL